MRTAGNPIKLLRMQCERSLRSSHPTLARDTVTVVAGHFDALVCRGLVDALREDHRFCVLASDLEDAALERAIAEQLPRVAILGEAGNYDLLVRIKASHPAMGVLVLARDPAPMFGSLLVVVGATCLARTASVPDILAAVLHAGALGKPTFFCADGDRVALRGPDGYLTAREMEVFEYLSLGRSYTEIGCALHITPETARKHTISICRKLHAKSKRELIGMPLSIGLSSRRS
jgi:DNA-binding NarL/FixJ family response regulator